MRVLITFLSLLLLSACSTMKVETDYSPEFAFDTLSTFTIVHKDKEGDNTLTASRIIDALSNDLTTKGYQAVERSAADYYVLFHTDVRSKTKVDTDYQSLGMYPYRYGRGPGRGYGYNYGGMTTSTTRVYTYDEGKLIVDIVDPRDNDIIWRGIATDRLKSHDDPDERRAYIDEVIAELLKTFPVKKNVR